MPKQRQRTLLEFTGSSSPTKRSSPLNERRLTIESDDSASDPGKIKFRRDVSSSSQDSGDDKPLASRHSASISMLQKDASFLVNSYHSTSSESLPVVPSRRSRKSAGEKRIVLTSDESNNERETKRRRLVKGRRSLPSPDEDENEDLVEEVDEDKILASRLRGRPKKTEFVRNLERLQRRRRGEASPESEESRENDSEPSLSHTAPAQAVRSAYSADREKTDAGEDSSLSDDNDFIIQDDGDEFPELPIMFSMDTYQNLSHHFKVICQLFVHLAVTKPTKRRSFMENEMKTNYFSVPLTIVRRKLDAMKDSLVTSSTWNTEFKVPLQSLPEFRLERLDFSIPLCDACRIGNRVATLRGIVGGTNYDRLTFEPWEESSTGINNNRSSEVEWNLGRFCAARAQVFHLFSHWEYVLYHTLRQEVEILQEALITSGDNKTRISLPLAQGASAPDDPSDADGIMDWLDGRGIISFQWIKIKSMLDRARKLENGKDAEEDLDMT